MRVEINVNPTSLRAIHARSLLIMLLIYVGQFRVITHTQGHKYLTFECRRAGIAPENVVTDTIIEALKLGFLLEVRLGHKTKSTNQIILHLSYEGFAEVMRHSSEVEDEMRYGILTDYQVKKIPHDILLAEIPLLLGADYDITALCDETYLRGENMRHRHANARKNVNLNLNIGTDEQLPDCRVGVYHRPTGIDEWRYYEAAVKYSREKIEDKRRHVTWLTSSSYEADKISLLRPERVELVQPLTAAIDPDYDKEVQAALGTRIGERLVRLTLLERLILSRLRETQLTMSLRELPMFIKAGPQSLLRAVNELISAELVRVKYAAVTCADFEVGSMPYICMPENHRHVAGRKFRRHLLLNEVLPKMIEQGYEFRKFNPQQAALTVARGRERLVLISDIDGSYDSADITQISDLYHYYADQSSARVCIVVTDPHRDELLRKTLGRYLVFGMTDYTIS